MWGYSFFRGTYSVSDRAPHFKQLKIRLYQQAMVSLFASTPVSERWKI